MQSNQDLGECRSKRARPAHAKDYDDEEYQSYHCDHNLYILLKLSDGTCYRQEYTS